jgi:quinol monooxygenase YgiN
VQYVALSGRFTAKAEHRAAIAGLARGLYGPSRAEAGCKSYACFAQTDVPDAMLFFEEWASEAALEEHFATPYFADFMKQFPPLIAGSPAITIFNITVVSDAEPGNPQAAIVLAGRFTAKAARRDELVALSQSMLAPSRAEDGCVSYDFLEEIGAPGNFLFFERWRNKAALDTHFAGAGFAAFAQAFPDMIEGAADIRLFGVSTERTL